MNTSILRIAIFSVDEFDDWKIYMHEHLSAMHDEIWYVIENNPIKIIKVNIAAKWDPEAPQILEKPIAEYTPDDMKRDNLDNMAWDILYKTLDKAMFDKIKSCKTTKKYMG